MNKVYPILIILILTISANAQWQQIGTEINGEVANDISGSSVSINSDGSIIAVGAHGSDANGDFSGQVRIYENQSGAWEQIGQDINGEIYSNTGYAVDLNSDGSIIVIGAQGGASGKGSAQIFENTGGVWLQIGSNIEGEAINDYFGFSVSINSDGSIVAIGGRYNDGNSVDEGYVQIYENQSGNWVQIGDDINGENAEDLSGVSVSLSSNGQIVAIGASDNDGNGNASGHVRVYENQSGLWEQIGQDIDGEAIDDRSGGSISLNSDGSIIAIGANANDGNGAYSGHVRIFEYQTGVWVQIGQDIDGETAGDRSGSLSINSDGSVVAIGAYSNDDNGDNSGHVRVYKNQGGTWEQLGQDIDGDIVGDCLGSSLCLSSDGLTVVIGSPCNDDSGTDAGQVNIFYYHSDIGINEVTEESIAIYPNPTIGQLTINAKNIERIEIYNLSGLLIESIKQKDIDLSEQAKGIYFVKIITESRTETRKILLE